MKVLLNEVEHDFDPSRVTFGEAILIERTSGLSFTQWAEATGEGSMTGMAVYVLVLLRRDNPKATMADVEAMDIASFQLIPDEDDLAAAEAAEGVDREAVEDPT